MSFSPQGPLIYKRVLPALPRDNARALELPTSPEREAHLHLADYHVTRFARSSGVASDDLRQTALMAILQNRKGTADGGIFNIGNPANDLAIEELAHRMIAAVAAYPGFEERARNARIVDVSSEDYYGRATRTS